MEIDTERFFVDIVLRIFLKTGRWFLYDFFQNLDGRVLENALHSSENRNEQESVFQVGYSQVSCRRRENDGTAMARTLYV
jgi:hypothetical protein